MLKLLIYGIWRTCFIEVSNFFTIFALLLYNALAPVRFLLETWLQGLRPHTVNRPRVPCVRLIKETIFRLPFGIIGSLAWKTLGKRVVRKNRKRKLMATVPVKHQKMSQTLHPGLPPMAMQFWRVASMPLTVNLIDNEKLTVS